MSVEYKGEARLEPVDVDVIDNLVNAGAAYLDAFATASAHFEFDGEGLEETLVAIKDGFVKSLGSILFALAIERM